MYSYTKHVVAKAGTKHLMVTNHEESFHKVQCYRKSKTGGRHLKTHGNASLLLKPTETLATQARWETP